MKVEGHSDNNESFKLTYGYSYVLSRLLKEVYSDNEIEGHLAGPAHFNRVLRKQLEQGMLPLVNNLSF